MTWVWVMLALSGIAAGTGLIIAAEQAGWTVARQQLRQQAAADAEAEHARAMERLAQVTREEAEE
jgi:hypothetical protein